MKSTLLFKLSILSFLLISLTSQAQQKKVKLLSVNDFCSLADAKTRAAFNKKAAQLGYKYDTTIKSAAMYIGFLEKGGLVALSCELGKKKGQLAGIVSMMTLKSTLKQKGNASYLNTTKANLKKKLKNIRIEKVKEGKNTFETEKFIGTNYFVAIQEDADKYNIVIIKGE